MRAAIRFWMFTGLARCREGIRSHCFTKWPVRLTVNYGLYCGHPLLVANTTAGRY